MTENILDGYIFHNLEIDLINGDKLFYKIGIEDAEFIKKWFSLFSNPMELHNSENNFIYFETSYNRFVFINIDEINNICLSFDVHKSADSGYVDNFNLLDKKEKETVIDEYGNKLKIAFPDDAIFKMKGNSAPITLDHITNKALPFPMDFINQKDFYQKGIIQLEDPDGDTYFMPLRNISHFEVDRKLFYTDEEWDEFLLYNQGEKL